MPLLYNKSKQAFNKNVSKEMESGKPQNQALAIAYNIKRKNKKPQGYAQGGEVNEDLHPEHNNPDAVSTSSLDSMHQASAKQNHDQPIETPAEPRTYVSPEGENMGRNDPDGDRIMRAVRMALGGRVDEQHKPVPNEDRMWAAKDTYPPGPAESDTQAQDEGFGDEPMRNEMGDSDQDMQRKRMKKALGRE